MYTAETFSPATSGCRPCAVPATSIMLQTETGRFMRNLHRVTSSIGAFWIAVYLVTQWPCRRGHPPSKHFQGSKRQFYLTGTAASSSFVFIYIDREESDERVDCRLKSLQGTMSGELVICCRQPTGYRYDTDSS